MKERISDLEEKTSQTTQTIIKRNEESLQDIWDTIKPINICTIGIPEREEKEKWH